MTSLEALCYLDDIAHGRKMIYDPHSLKLLIEEELEAFNILKKYIKIEEDDDDLFPYSITDKQYVSSRSCLVMSCKEFEAVKRFL